MVHELWSGNLLEAFGQSFVHLCYHPFLFLLLDVNWFKQARLNVEAWAVHAVSDKRLDLLKLKFNLFYSNPISDLIEIEIAVGEQFRNSFL